MSALVVVALVIGGLAATTDLFLRGPNVADVVDEEFEVAWEYEPGELEPDNSSRPVLASVASPQFGGQREQVIVTPQAWVMVIEHGAARAVVGLDPQTGSPMWEHTLAQAQCSAQPGPDDTVVCLASENGEDWTGHVLRADTGEEVNTFTTPISGAWGVHLTGAGLAVLAESTTRVFDRLTLLDPAEGTEQWSVDLLADDETAALLQAIDVDEVEHTVVPQPQWHDVGPNFTLSYASTDLFVDATAGEISVLQCYPAIITSGSIGCSSHHETVMYDGDAEQVWASPQVQLARPPVSGEHVLVNVADESLWQTEWDSGAVVAEVGPTESRPIVSGTAEQPFVMHEREVVAFAESEELWRTTVRGMNSITTVMVIGDVAIVDGFSTLGLDLATGEDLWVRYRSGNLRVIDDELVSIGTGEIAVLQLP